MNIKGNPDQNKKAELDRDSKLKAANENLLTLNKSVFSKPLDSLAE